MLPAYRIDFPNDPLGFNDDTMPITYRAILDGSGTIGQHRAVVYAGLLGRGTQVYALAEGWALLLQEHSLRYFKLAEALTFYGEFQSKFTEWGEERERRRDLVVSDFIQVARGYGLQVIGAGVDAKVFTERTTVENKLKLFKRTLQDLLVYVPSKYNILLTCDMEHDVEHNYRSWVNSFRQDNYALGSRIVGTCFFDSKNFPEIQAADLVAGLIRQELERRIAGRPDSKVNSLYTSLTEGTNVTIDLIDPGDF